MRTRKLIAPSLQLKLASWFICTVLAGLLFQYVYVTSQLSTLAHDFTGDPSKDIEALSAVSWKALWTSILVVLPLTVIVGVLTTFRLVGPIYRLGDFLSRIVAGDKPEDCKLRKGDELQDFCQVLNEATRPLRVSETAEEAGSVRRSA